MYDVADRRVHIERCSSYGSDEVLAAVSACFEKFGIADEVRGKRVLIKPNLLTAHAPEKAATAHPEVVYAAAKLCFDAGAASVTIGDSCGGVFNKPALDAVYRVTGMASAAERSGAALNDDFGDIAVAAKGGKALKTFRLGTYITSAEYIISIPKLKTHTYARMTCAVKNMYGAVAGLNKAKYHAMISVREQFAEMLCDLCDTVAPSFTLVDGVVGMEGKGPGTGDPRFAGVIFAAVNPFCADIAAAELMCMSCKIVPTIVEGISRGYCPDSTEWLEMSGAPVKSVRVRFVPPPMMIDAGLLSLLPGRLRVPVTRFIEPFPIISDRCVGCGECARACPKKAIEIVSHHAHIDRSLCIKCYCCHELCRVKAIELKRALITPKG